MATNRKATRKRAINASARRSSGTAERPRLAVHFSGKHIYAQVIDDDAGKTLASATPPKRISGKDKAARQCGHGRQSRQD